MLRYSYAILVVVLCGCTTQVGALRRLAEPGNAQVSVVPALALAGPLQSASVALSFPDARTECMMMREDWMGDAKGDALFASGAIVEGVFRKVAESMFHVASQEEQPVAVFRVRIKRTTAKATLGGVEATVGLKIEIVKPEGGAPCFTETFEATETAPWSDRDAVPDAFYLALQSVVTDLATKWIGCGAVAAMLKWRDEMAPEIIPPALRAIEWTHSGDVWAGTCEVLCNGYEGFDAKSWANARIAAACRTKLGGIEPERVRIVYDEEDYNADARRWVFRFRTFARTRIALSFDKTTRHGVVTGDLELMEMKVGPASEALKRFVQDEMDSRAGKVSRAIPRGMAELRFDDFVMDTAYNLVTIRFRLL